MSSAEDWLKQAEEQNEAALEEAADLRTVVATTRGHARSGDGLIQATVAPGGALVTLELDDRVMSGTAFSLQQSIVETIRRASQDAAQQLESAVRPIVGDRYEDALAAASSEMPEIEGLPEREQPEDDDESLFGDRR